MLKFWHSFMPPQETKAYVNTDDISIIHVLNEGSQRSGNVRIILKNGSVLCVKEPVDYFMEPE